MFKREKENLPKRSYAEVMDDLQKAETAKEYRAIHRELKRDHDSKLFLFQRYPRLPIVIVFIVLFVNMVSSVAALLIKLLD